MYIITLNEMHISWSDCWVAGPNSLRNTNQPGNPIIWPSPPHAHTYKVLLVIVQVLKY